MRSIFLLAFVSAGALAQPGLVQISESTAANRTSAVPVLADLHQRALTLTRLDRVNAARETELDAKNMANQAMFPGAPSLGFDVRRDLPSGVALPGTTRANAIGRNELEPGLSVPIWLPGQREAQRRILLQERALLNADLRFERLRVAGQVREVAWAFEIAATRLRLKQVQLDSARALEADVKRRVQAGDLAPVDLSLALSNTLAAEADFLDSQAQLASASVDLKRLTGSVLIGSLSERSAGLNDLASHPALQMAREAVSREQSRLELAMLTRRDSPTISAVARFDRDSAGAAYRNTFRVGINFPLDTEARNAPLLAAAATTLTESEVALQQRERELEAEVERARIILTSKQAMTQTQAARALAATQMKEAIERAFRAGERSLAELLRVQSLAFEAELAQQATRNQIGLSQARLNQALGLEP